MPKPPPPTEYDEQCAFVDWMEIKGLRFTAIPNATYTESWTQKAKNKRMGLRPGLPDLLVVVPAEKSNTGGAALLFVEMKRQKGGKVEDSQEAWLATLNQVKNVEGKICRGFDEATAFVGQFLAR